VQELNSDKADAEEALDESLAVCHEQEQQLRLLANSRNATPEAAKYMSQVDRRLIACEAILLNLHVTVNAGQGYTHTHTHMRTHIK
jgi:hypothetical protein